MTQDSDATLESSLKRLLVVTEKAEQWQQVLEEPSAIEILGDMLLHEVSEGKIHQGAALGWLLAARQHLLSREHGGVDTQLWEEPNL